MTLVLFQLFFPTFAVAFFPSNFLGFYSSSLRSSICPGYPDTFLGSSDADAFLGSSDLGDPEVRYS